MVLHKRERFVGYDQIEPNTNVTTLHVEYLKAQLLDHFNFLFM